MRARNFLAERPNPLEVLKSKVKRQIDTTDNETLLNRIYTSLNSGTLNKRLAMGLENLSDPEIQSFVDDIGNAIVQAPGTYEEKLEFVKGLHEGFIDIDKMINGKRHHFADLLTPTKKVSLKFLFNMFNALKDLGGRVKKGPGEFAIAIMSPQVSVFGGGDLKIGKTIVEVKAEKGTIGGTSYFQHSKVPIILKKYIPEIDTTKNIGADALAATIRVANLDPQTLKAFAEELVTYIFKAQEAWANTDPLKQAIQNPTSSTYSDDIRRSYLVAAYSAYKGREEGKSKFDGVMIMDYTKQELRYFNDPEELFNDVDKVQFNFFSTNKEWGGKLINPSVKLRTSPVNKPEAPQKANRASLDSYVQQQADYVVKKAQQRYPQNIDLRDPELLKDVAGTIRELTNKGFKGPKINSELLKKFPELRIRGVEQEPVAPTPVAPKPRQRTPVTPTQPALAVSKKQMGMEPTV
jgi:hypothetical protein